MRRLALLVLVALFVGTTAAIPYALSRGVFERKRSNAVSGEQSAEPDPAPSASPAATPTSPAPTDEGLGQTPQPIVTPLVHAGPVTVKASGYWSWAVVNRTTGDLAGSPNATAVNVTASMSKAWLAADYLRRAAEQGKTPNSATLGELTDMIRDSDNDAAAHLWGVNGGSASVARLKSICGLTDSRHNIDWANMLMSARDAARMGACIGDGRAAGAKWTAWLLNEMRNVREGRFGIIQALPAAVQPQTAIKNGWIPKSDGKWHINCLAIGADWALAVMTVYPATLGMNNGINICKSVTAQLMAPVT